jgi:hypothetical protein
MLEFDEFWPGIPFAATTIHLVQLKPGAAICTNKYLPAI